VDRDPLGYGAGLNLYAFVGNNPINRIDAFGLYEDSVLDCATREGHVTRARDAYACDDDVQDYVRDVFGPMIDPSPEVVCDWLGRLAKGLNLADQLNPHNILDALGLIEGFGSIADLINAGLYWLEGDYGQAAFASAAALPIVGLVAAEVKAAKKLPNEAFVVRGGLNTPESVASGMGTHPSGIPGVSVESAAGKSVAELAAGPPPIPNSKIGVTTVGDVRAAGGDVLPTSGMRPNHATLTGLPPEDISKLLQPPIPNPAKSK